MLSTNLQGNKNHKQFLALAYYASLHNPTKEIPKKNIVAVGKKKYRQNIV
jgi:hypothetical protein